MRRWIIAVVTTLTVAGVAVVARARSATPDAEALADRNPEVAAARALLRARNDTLQAWSQAHHRAVLIAGISSLRPSDAPFAVETRGAVSARTREAFTAAIDAELRELPAPRVPIRLLLITDETVRSEYFGQTFLRPQRAGEPCVIAIRVSARNDASFVPRSGLQRLGPCGLYAIAGMPGPGIARWLDSTRSRAALSYRAPVPPSEDARRQQLHANEILAWRSPLSCAAGRDASCAAALFDPFANRRRLPRVVADEGSAIVSTYYFEHEDYPGEVAAALRQSLGDERFAQWWASELPPAEAYERITGERFAAFAQAYLRPRLGHRTPGPLSAGLPTALGILLAAALSAWAIRGTLR
ncbi:MAG TPA: hypothetical protein PK788_01915, partial [Gemmatimonadaceae bacterium]|nr:hypothetical protein [Gemmatimonadaceae bacterium]